MLKQDTLPWPWHSWKRWALAQLLMIEHMQTGRVQLDMKYNHAYYATLYDQEIQESESAAYDKEITQISHKQVSK